MNLPPELQSAMLGRRVVFLRGRLDDALANAVIAQLLLVAQMDASTPVDVYVDSQGGSLAAALSVFDVLRTLSAPVSTRCVGAAGGAAVLVLAGGAAGRRFALPHARIHLSHERLEVPAGSLGDLAGQTGQATQTRQRWQAALAGQCGHSAERIERDMTAGVWLSAAEARDYGIVDGIVPGRPSGGISP
jgi:ATP-dependent Clp protease, protease subunit